MHSVAGWAAGPLLAVCLLLAWSGVAKLRRPDATRGAARAIGLPSSPLAVRVLGATELTIASAAAAIGGLAAALVAVFYAGLAGVAYTLRRQAPATPCGCLGARDVPVARAHIVVNAAAALVAGGAAFAGSPFARIDDLPLAGVPFVVLVICAARLTVLAIELLPQLVRVSTEGGPR